MESNINDISISSIGGNDDVSSESSPNPLSLSTLSVSTGTTSTTAVQLPNLTSSSLTSSSVLGSSSASLSNSSTTAPSSSTRIATCLAWWKAFDIEAKRKFMVRVGRGIL